MDPRARADAALARARARGAHVVTPDNMTSPMDASATQQIPRTVVNAMDQRNQLDPESTMILSGPLAAGRPPAHHQPPPLPEPELRVGPGPVPTVQQVANGRPSLTQRLSGNQDPHRPPGLSGRLNGD
ncbi:hypothetical protein [Actinosynnema sp. NPDC020468]|uniref:hypothetical protein n=1 Tax=Actinosynnema sp. NPDC020468 TaxID=3154488 RepID=UPI0033F26BAB